MSVHSCAPPLAFLIPVTHTIVYSCSCVSQVTASILPYSAGPKSWVIYNITQLCPFLSSSLSQPWLRLSMTLQNKCLLTGLPSYSCPLLPSLLFFFISCSQKDVSKLKKESCPLLGFRSFNCSQTHGETTVKAPSTNLNRALWENPPPPF